MKTEINNSMRVLMIYTSTAKQCFCNPQDLKRCMAEMRVTEGYYTVYEFWNGKQKKLSKKAINEFLNLKN